MLIYGNTPKDITKMMFRNKTKILLLVGAVVLAVSLGTNRAVACETDKNLLDTVKAVPTKVATHISNEISDTKEYQAKSWAEMKAQWTGFKTKFLSK
jgi:vancomycin permeability regulator SanA